MENELVTKHLSKCAFRIGNLVFASPCKNLKRIWTENGLIWALIGLKTPVKVKMATAKHSKAEELCYMQGRAKIFVEINANSSNFGNNGYIPQSKVPKSFYNFLKKKSNLLYQMHSFSMYSGIGNKGLSHLFCKIFDRNFFC